MNESDMKVPPILDNNMRTYFRSHYSKEDPNSIQGILFWLKSEGYSQMQSVFLLVEQGQMSFAEANQLVLNSKAWN